MLDDLVGDAGRFAVPTVDPESLAILQFTSGSTADPKGVMLPHRCVTANIDAILRGAAFDIDRERVASWLPLYHDMGLIGLLGVPMTTGVDLVLAGPQDFLAAPGRWLDWMSTFGCTVTGGPNFSYALAARALQRSGDLDLRAWRLALNGAEPIDPDSVEAFLGAGAPFGLGAGTAFCVYGMAEATLAITFPEPGAGMTVDTVDRRVLETDSYAAPSDADRAGARRLPLLGRVLDGLELRVVDPDTGAGRHDREVGEVELRGASITPGYFRNPEATAASFRDGWLRTGDLGYVVDGELVICGRRKDVIIVGGRNVFPEDIERAAAGVDGVRAGNVIAFGTTSRRGPRGDRRRRRDQGRRRRHRTRCGPRSPSGSPTRSASRRARSCSSPPARSPRRRRGSSSARSARTATSATSSNPSDRHHRAARAVVRSSARGRSGSPRRARGSGRSRAGRRPDGASRRARPGWSRPHSSSPSAPSSTPRSPSMSATRSSGTGSDAKSQITVRSFGSDVEGEPVVDPVHVPGRRAPGGSGRPCGRRCSPRRRTRRSAGTRRDAPRAA